MSWNSKNRRTTPIDNATYLSGLYDLLNRRADPQDETEWADVVDYMNAHTDGDYKRDFVRKAFPIYDLFNSAGWVRPPDDVGGSSFDAKRLEAQKAIVKLRDERNEISRIQRELARRESLIDLVREGMRAEVQPVPGYSPREVVASDNDLIVHLTDIHCGIAVDNFCNEYSVEVMHQRFGRYLDKIAEIRHRHCSQNCYVLLGGDLISGLIHSNLRLENNLDVIKQVKVVSMALTGFMQALSDMFGDVHVYSVPGNHSRVQPKKEDNLRGENLDILVPFILSLSLSEYRNVHIHEENIEPTVAMFHVRGQQVFGVHGDKDSMESVVQRLTMVFGSKPDIVLAGHRHTNGMRTVYDTKVVESGSVVGSDSYCMDNRLRNKPEQTVLVVSETGLDCLYDIQLA